MTLASLYRFLHRPFHHSSPNGMNGIIANVAACVGRVLFFAAVCAALPCGLAAEIVDPKASVLPDIKDPPIYGDPDQPVAKRVADLIRRMSLKEKISQLMNNAPPIERLSLPGYEYWNECLHGVGRAGQATVFPQAIGMAAMWDPDELQKVADVIATEGRAKNNEARSKNPNTRRYYGLTFWSPNINIFRDPRWGRGQETYGEDPFLTARLGVAFIRGLQGTDPKYMKVMACAKHYAVHSGPEKLRHGFDALPPIRDLYETYLPQFEAAVEEGKVGQVMSAYNSVDGVPGPVNKFLLTDLLRDRWGFEGFVVSDCGAVQDVWRHHKFVKTAEEASALAIKAGNDLECGGTFASLVGAVNRELVTEKEIDAALAHVLSARFRLGLFDPPERCAYLRIPPSENIAPTHGALAAKTACDSLVLLKNDGALPLDRKKVRRIALIGPNADSVRALLGNYNGEPVKPITLRQGLSEVAGKEIEITCNQGCPIAAKVGETLSTESPEFKAAVSAARAADVVIFASGMDASMEGEEMGTIYQGFDRGDRSRIELPAIQTGLLKALAATGKPVVLVNFSGSAVAMPWEAEHLSAIVQAWYPGQDGGRAVANVLFGDYNPAGHLPVTFYNSTDDLPDFTDYAMANRTYRYFGGKVLYPFGHGLTYTKFTYGKPELSASSLSPDGKITVSIDIKNDGPRDGAEVVQVYVKHLDSKAPMPIHSLAAFRRVDIAKGQTAKVDLEIPAGALRYWDETSGKYVVPEGMADIQVGASSADIRGTARLQITASKSIRANDDLFPPAPAAAGVINFDGRGFLINGQRVFLTSGSVHYPRVPRENWRDVLLKLKRAGFNAVETYAFWSYHEAVEGRFDFTTDSRDIGAFLDTAKEVGLYAIVRVGPYACAEWENGGFPNWLYFKPGLEARKDNEPFLKAVDAWFNKLLPIVSARQIHKGGNVILVQLENEYPAERWRYSGTEIYGHYFQHLLDLAHANGLEVPMFFSGLNHSHDPAPESPIDSTARKSPWVSMELWTIWFDRYGVDRQDLLKGDRSTWRVLAKGGNGFNLYMAHGGTSFAYFNFNDDQKFGDKREKGAASYDYGTLIGQAGDTRDLYLRLKRLGYFADTFSSILANGTNSTDHFQDFAFGATVTARTSPGGTLVFLDNAAPANAAIKAKLHVKTAAGAPANAVLKNGSRIKLAEGEIIGLAMNVPIAPGVTIDEADTRILGIVPQDGIVTLVCYGEPGDTGKITFETSVAASAKTVNDAGFKFDTQGNPSLTFDFPSNGVGEEILAFGASRLRVLAMSKATADQTWFVDTAAGRLIVVGAPYLGDFAMDASGKVQFTVDYPWSEPAPTEIAVYHGGETRKIKLPAPSEKPSPETLDLTEWRMSPDDAPLAKEFDDRDWFTLPGGNPPVMGADGDNSAFAWYRTQLKNNEAITSLNFKRIGDRATFFVDGKLAATYDLKKDKTPDIALNLPAGAHDLAIFTSHFGRPKFAGYMGPIDKLQYQKGLCAPVTVNGASEAVQGWKMRGGVDPENPKLQWSSVKSTDGTPAYFRTSFKLDAQPEPGAAYRLATDGISFGSVWLNGHNVGRYPEILKACPGLWLPGCWMKKGENTLVIFDERGNSPEKVGVKLEIPVSRHHLKITD